MATNQTRYLIRGNGTDAYIEDTLPAAKAVVRELIAGMNNRKTWLDIPKISWTIHKVTTSTKTERVG